MRCEIYGSPTSTHYTQIVGHIADDGNVYNSRNSEAGCGRSAPLRGPYRRRRQRLCHGKGLWRGCRQLRRSHRQRRQHLRRSPQLFRRTRPLRRPRGGGRQGLYHAGRRFRRARPLRGAGAGRRARTGRGGAAAAFEAGRFLRVRGRERRFGRRRVRRRQFGRRHAGSERAGASRGAESALPHGGRIPAGDGLRFVLFTLLAGIVGYIFSNRNAAISAGFGLCAGVALALLFTLHEGGVVVFDFDTAACKSGLLRLLFGRRAFWGLIFPSCCWAWRR